MASSPRSPRRRQKTKEERAAEAQFFAISPDKKEANRVFKTHVAGMVKTFRDLTKVIKKLYASKSKHQAIWPDGRIVEKKDIKGLESEFAELIKQMTKYRKYSNMRAPRVGGSAAQYAPKSAAVMQNGQVLKNIPGFFQEALNNRKLTGPQGQVPSIANLLAGPDHLTTNKELTSLFIIYVYSNGLQNTQTGQSRYLNVANDPLFMKWFKSTIEVLENQPQKFNKKTGKAIKPFNRNQFTFINLQQIIALNTTSSGTMTDGQFESANQKKTQLTSEADAVARIKQTWDDQRKPIKEQNKQMQQKAAQARKKTTQTRVVVQPSIRRM